jgi:hypothetical protein
MKNKLQSLIYIHSSTVLCHLMKFKYYSRLTVRISFWKKHHEYHINVVHLSFSRLFDSFDRMAVSKYVPFPHRIRPHKAINTNAKYNWQSVIILYSVIQTSTEKKSLNQSVQSIFPAGGRDSPILAWNIKFARVVPAPSRQVKTASESQ